MLVFPNAKINIGLNITGKREDGFHNLETIMIPVPLTDALEFVESKSLQFDISGLPIEGNSDNNLVLKAYHLIRQQFDIPPLHIHLHKNIPTGAGLGGGSSDGAFMLKMLNDHFNLGLSITELTELAATLGSDCPFFIQNVPVFATGRGEITEPVDVNLKGYYLLLVKPSFGISTQEAYSKVIPAKSRLSLKALIDFSIGQWKSNIRNQFEKTLFPDHPELAEIKETMYKLGAVYASMTGSGSAIYGLFRSGTERFAPQFNSDYFVFSSRL